MCFINGENLKDLPVGLNSNRSVSVVNTSAFSSMNVLNLCIVKDDCKNNKSKIGKKVFQALRGIT